MLTRACAILFIWELVFKFHTGSMLTCSNSKRSCVWTKFKFHTGSMLTIKPSKSSIRANLFKFHTGSMLTWLAKINRNKLQIRLNSTLVRCSLPKKSAETHIYHCLNSTLVRCSRTNSPSISLSLNCLNSTLVRCSLSKNYKILHRKSNFSNLN